MKLYTGFLMWTVFVKKPPDTPFPPLDMLRRLRFFVAKELLEPHQKSGLFLDSKNNEENDGAVA